ncbi:pyridoxal phosphate-dependent transferase [Glomus cerebriforme]|uniref:Pyridoxal phosphate-dependent transferase n=1 Tax=Glomus cerebriforme TaxID=658196 RepID=A0A397TGL2_9GLOM|nr:pyridoxal phosphate-dependent transferase [Glomus cerebriforme]
MRTPGLSEKRNFNSQKFKDEKRNFLKEFSTKYGYNGKIDQIREEEYPQLKNEIYLDHTGATTFARSAVVNFNNDILTNLYGNPHSNSPSSRLSSMRIEQVRKRVLSHFGTNEKDYTVIFTQNATAAIKLVGEMFPWTEKSTYKNLRESHNSVNGLRRFLETINPDNIQGVTEKEVKAMFKNPPPVDDQCRYDDNYEKDDEINYNLFAYPAQCNYSGMRFPLSWVRKIKKLNTKTSKTLVLLDAAAFVPSSPLSLANKDESPDFICLSFYKMFGFPTGLGALIVKTELNPILRKGYFGGGTINSVVYDKNWQEFSKDMTTRYEDGTVNFLNIISLDHAFDAFERNYGNIKNISSHVTSLNSYLYRNMKSLRHWNGQSVCTINSDRDFSNSKKQGGIFSFNVKRSDGSYVGYIELEKLASTYGIHIRSGGNCNPGSIARWNHIAADEIIRNYGEGKYCSDDRDIYKGKLYGAARVSIGAMTTIDEILIWLEFFKRFYVEIMPGKTVHDLSTSKFKIFDKSEKSEKLKFNSISKNGFDHGHGLERQRTIRNVKSLVFSH